MEGGLMRSVTIDQVITWGPCQPEYSEERLRELAAGRESLTAEDIAILPIPLADRLWALLHPEVIPEPALHELACKYNVRALHSERRMGRDPDQRSWDAIKAKRRWLAGEITDADLHAPGAATRAASRSAAWAAAIAARDAEFKWQLDKALEAARNA